MKTWTSTVRLAKVIRSVNIILELIPQLVILPRTDPRGHPAGVVPPETIPLESIPSLDIP